MPATGSVGAVSTPAPARVHAATHTAARSTGYTAARATPNHPAAPRAQRVAAGEGGVRRDAPAPARAAPPGDGVGPADTPPVTSDGASAVTQSASGVVAPAAHASPSAPGRRPPVARDAVVGAASGAVLGAIVGHGMRGALAGMMAGGAIGAAIGARDMR
jgi:hypothetical protein